MKKLFSKILAFAMIVSALSTTAFAVTVDLGDVSVDNIDGVSDYVIFSDDFPLPIYLCEDFARITLNDDIAWINLKYSYDPDNMVGIGPFTKDENGDFVATFNADVVIDKNTTLTMPEFFEAADNGKITVEQINELYIAKGGYIDVLFEGVYILELVELNSNVSYFFNFQVVDNDGVNSYVPADTTTEEEIEVPETSEIVAGTAKAATAKVMVDGKEVEFEAYEIEGNNYFKLRDLAAVVSGSKKQFEVTWDEELNAIGLISGKSYTEVGGELAVGDGLNKEFIATAAKIYKDDAEVNFTAFEINDNNYFKLRDVCKAFDIGVTWDDATQTIGVDTSISYAE